MAFNYLSTVTVNVFYIDCNVDCMNSDPLLRSTAFILISMLSTVYDTFFVS